MEKLRKRLIEGSHRVHNSDNHEDFITHTADLLEVLQKMVKHHGTSWSEVEDALTQRLASKQNGAVSNVRPELLTPESENSLLDVIKRELGQSRSFYAASAFCTRSMLNLLVTPLKEFVDNGGKAHILTSMMNNFNNPDDLLHIQDQIPQIAVKLFYPPEAHGSSTMPSFHLKCYIFEKEDGKHSIVVGSSNLTQGGLLKNHEWNYFSNSEVNLCHGEQRGSTFDQALSQYDNYWTNQSIGLDHSFIDTYRELWLKSRESRKELSSLAEQLMTQVIEPRPAQLKALDALSQKRKTGINKTAVIAATGLGKTYLSAFDFKASGMTNVLFLAHREEILKSSQASYAKVTGEKSFGVVLSGNSTAEERGQAFISGVSVFSMVQTLCKDHRLNSYAPDFFDYIVIDEFHHSEAASYQKVLNHFTPKFMLGLTATPERMDGRDVMRFCDYDIAYESRLLDAVENNWLVPFQYYAIYDESDYSELKWNGRKYDEQELTDHLSKDSRAQLIINNINKYLPATGKLKTLAFCSSVLHARYMASKFCEAGIEAIALAGTNTQKERQQAISDLQNEDHPLKVICSVDIFGEGVDIPAVSHVLMLRPTESNTVFLQQLGRGLRISEDKEFLVVLDFIGNFKKSYIAPMALTGTFNPEEFPQVSLKKFLEDKLPDLCHLHADINVERLWSNEIERIKPKKNRKEYLAELYWQLRENLGHSLNMLDFYANPEVHNPLALIKLHGSWLKTKQELKDLTEYEKSLIGKESERFLEYLEKQLNPNKSYKMVVLLYLLQTPENQVEWSVEEIATAFKQYYVNHPERAFDYDEMARAQTLDGFPLKKVISKVSSMPLSRLTNGDNDYFTLDKESGIFSLDGRINHYWTDPSFRELIHDRVLFRLEYYFYSKR